jgi:hypothetical protein
MSAGWVGSQFVLNSAAKASAARQFIPIAKGILVSLGESRQRSYEAIAFILERHLSTT